MSEVSFLKIFFVLYDGGHNKKKMDLSVFANKLFFVIHTILRAAYGIATNSL